MPELPEVETTRRGIRPYVEGRLVERVEIRNRALRWPVAVDFEAAFEGQTVSSVGRRAKYLLFNTNRRQRRLCTSACRAASTIVPAMARRRAFHDHVDFDAFDSEEDRQRYQRPATVRFIALGQRNPEAALVAERPWGPSRLADDFDGAITSGIAPVAASEKSRSSPSS